MDRPALPVFPSPADAPYAALHRDGDDRRDPARRPAQASRVRSGRAAGRASAWRLRSRGARAMRAHRRGVRLSRNQSQRRLSVRPRAGRPLRRVPDGGARAGRRLRRRDEGRGRDSGHGEVPHRHRRAGSGNGPARLRRDGGGFPRRCADRARAQGLAQRPVAAREPRHSSARLRPRLPAQGRASGPAGRSSTAAFRRSRPRASICNAWTA